MRRIDRWVGVPVSCLLTALRRCADLCRWLRRREPGPVRRILFVKPAEQGATVLAYPAIRKAVERVGRENVFFLVFEENRFILDVMGLLPEENVITIPTDGIGRLSVAGLRALVHVRRLHVDAAVDLEFFARTSAALAYLSGARVRVGLHGMGGDGAPYRGDLMTHRLPYNPDLHTIDAYAQMVEVLDVPAEEVPGVLDHDVQVDDRLPEFSPGPEELAGVEAVVRRELGAEEYSPLVLLNPNASDLLPIRRWPEPRYVELARRLIDRSPKAHVAFTGAPGEEEAADDLAGQVGSERCFSMAGKTTLRELLVLYCLADVLVTNDSGPAHFASLTPIQAITLFGPETPKRFGSRSPRTHLVWKQLPCSPCVDACNNRLTTCRHGRCMQQITVDEVFEMACGIMNI